MEIQRMLKYSPNSTYMQIRGIYLSPCLLLHRNYPITPELSSLFLCPDSMTSNLDIRQRYGCMVSDGLFLAGSRLWLSGGPRVSRRPAWASSHVSELQKSKMEHELLGARGSQDPAGDIVVSTVWKERQRGRKKGTQMEGGREGAGERRSPGEGGGAEGRAQGMRYLGLQVSKELGHAPDQRRLPLPSQDLRALQRESTPSTIKRKKRRQTGTWQFPQN